MKFLLIPFCGLLVSQAVSASDNTDNNLSFGLEVGLTHDSQLTVEEIDQYQASGDTANLIEFEADGNWKPTANFNFKAGYNYLNNNYHNSDDFDLAINRFYGDVSYDFSVVTLGASHHSIDAKLADEDFLDMERTGFYAGHLFANSFYLRAEMQDIEKTFDALSDRNATSDIFAVDAYYFFNQGLSFIALGIENEDAVAQQSHFSYESENYRATYSNEFSWLDKRNRFKLNWRYYQRDYQDTFPDLGQSREDTKNSFSLAWNFFFNDTFTMITEFEQTYSDSNLESADYDATQVSLVLRADF